MSQVVRRAWAVVGVVATLVSTAGAQSGLHVQAVTAGELHLTWSNDCAPTLGCAFAIERTPAGDVCVFEPVATAVSEVVYDDGGLTAGDRWCYRVRAAASGATSDWSTVACGTVQSGGDGQTASQTFTRTSSQSLYAVPLGSYTCQRRVGGTNRLEVLKNGVLLSPTAKGPVPQPTVGTSFTLTCALTPSTVTLALDGTVLLTVAP